MAAAAAKLDPWEVLVDGAVGDLEVCVWEAGKDEVPDLDTFSGSLVPVGLYRVNPSDLRRMVTAKGPISITRLDEIDGVEDQDPWFLENAIEIPLAVLLVREEPWARYLDARRTTAERSTRKEQLAEQRAPVELGAALRFLCEKSPHKFEQGSPPRPNIKQLAEALHPRLASETGERPTGFGIRNLSSDLTAALNALDTAIVEAESEKD